ncbi:hypothetical protein G7068_16270 [Leucobacter viscericola]|nr:hypothetical protein [Leucobacter viscericola]QIK64603.1 hypothetical protein G7068_16270 [Leucobacter viscericola]
MDEAAHRIAQADASDNAAMFSVMKNLEELLPSPKFASLSTVAGQYADALKVGDEAGIAKFSSSFVEATAAFDAECR